MYTLPKPNKKAVLLLRSRSFFGANIVNLPAIYLTKTQLQIDELTVFTDINVEYFYSQIPWVNHQYSTNQFFTILKTITPKTDFLYSMRPSMDTASLLGVIKRIPDAIGFSLRSKALNKLFNAHYPCDTQTYRAIAHIMPLIHYLKLEQPPTYYLRQSMLELMSSSNSTLPQTICIIPGAGGGEHKKWGIDHYWQLVQQLHQKNPNWHFAFIVGNSEMAEIDYLTQQQSSPISFSIQKNKSIPEMISLMEHSLLTISNDCGPSHIAQCLLKPFIGLYCEPNPEWFLTHDNSCAIYPIDGNIKHITVNEVFTRSCAFL